MPTNRKAKQAQKHYLSEHPGASRKEARENTQKFSKPRRRQAKKVLHASGGGLVDALAAPFELKPSTDPATRDLIENLLDLLDDVAPRPHPFPVELREALECKFTAIRSAPTPPIPDDVQAAAASITDLVSSLDDRQLVGAATELRITRQNVDYAVYLEMTHRNREAADDTLWSDVDSDAVRSRRADDDAEKERFRQRVVRDLKDHSGDAWDDQDRKVLRLAVAMRLAALGDAYLSVTEEPAPVELTWWNRPGGTLRADYTIPSAPQPLSALIQPSRRHSSDPTTSAEFYRPRRHRSIISYSCYVGVINRGAGDDADSPDFDRFGISGHHDLFGAKYAGARMISAIAADPAAARSQPQQRLLIPRAAQQEVDGATLPCDLADVLDAVAAETRSDEENLWGPWPHIVAEGNSRRLGSLTALILDSRQLPWPQPEHAANQASVSSRTFQTFLGSQGIRISELARAYLTSAEEAGPGELGLRVRHEAGLAAVVDRHGLRALVTELERHYPRIKDAVLEAGESEAFVDLLADPEALSDVLAKSI